MKMNILYIWISVIQKIYKNDSLNKSKLFFFSFSPHQTFKIQNGLILIPLMCGFFFFPFFQIEMLATLAIPEKNSKVGIFVIGAA